MDNLINHGGNLPHFTFIDLFAGIGGFRIAFQSAGGKCVFSSEYDRFAQDTYQAFFGERPDFAHIRKVQPPGDITKIPPEEIPDHDVLAAGFPCQPFSLAGVSKKQSLGREHGFKDPTQGTLFFTLKEIIKYKKPKAFLLENVKNLQSHDRGRTFRIIRESLEGELGYHITDRVIDASGWVPQHRERIYIVGFRPNNGDQNWEITDCQELHQIKPSVNRPSLDEILEEKVPEKYTLGPGTWSTLLRHKSYHEQKGQGFGYGLISRPFGDKITRTLSARYHKDGAEILIEQPGKNPRRLTPLECCRLMGFPVEYQKYFDGTCEQPVSDTQAYRQFGNSVVVPLVTCIAKAMIHKLQEAGALDGIK